MALYLLLEAVLIVLARAGWWAASHQAKVESSPKSEEYCAIHSKHNVRLLWHRKFQRFSSCIGSRDSHRRDEEYSQDACEIGTYSKRDNSWQIRKLAAKTRRSWWAAWRRGQITRPGFHEASCAFRLNLPSALHLETTAAHVPPPGLRYRALSNVAAVC